ncbi:MAG: acylphosphatase [Candidatus Heimdallarchaeaceae archaeon]
MVNSAEIKRVEIIVSGMVQGVFFRVSTREVAQKLGIRGTVCNLFDGSVKIIAEGTEEKLNRLIIFAKNGPPSAKVYDIDVKWTNAKNDLPPFRIVH